MTTGRPTRRVQLAAIAALAFILRAIWLVRPGSEWAVGPDSLLYLALARGIREGCGFAAFDGICRVPEVMRTPGYPLFLLPFLEHYRLAILAQAALGAFVCVCVAKFSTRRGDSLVGILAAAFVAVDVPTILNSKELITEALFQAVLTPAVLIALDGGAIVGGAMLGLATLVRPVGEVLVPLIALPFCATGNWRRAALALMLPLLIVACWAIRNDRVAGVLALTVEGPMNLYLYTAPAVVARHDGISEDAAWVTFEHELRARTQAAAEVAANPPSVYGYEPTIWMLESNPSLAAFMRSKSLLVIAAHPLDTAAITVEGLLRLAFAPYVLQSGWQGFINDRRTFAAVRFVSTALQSVVLIALWLGVLLALIDAPCDVDRWILLAAAILLLLPAAPYSVAVAIRYRAPAIPFLAVLAGIGVAPRLRRIRP
ncbi:MAG TPA: hypothetical protein VEU51_09425 [Candidatus Acidoferrales bacterium]|nr:hypothetical protein [Candidatus Acidoferrales bacterium]